MCDEFIIPDCGIIYMQIKERSEKMKKSANDKKKKEPRVTKEKRTEIVEFYNAYGKDETIARYKKELEEHFGTEYKIDEKKLKYWKRLCEEDGDKLNERSLLPIYIFEILRKYSSPNHPITEDQIKSKINSAEIFNPEIENPAKPEKEIIKSGKDGNRKIIPRHIRALIHHFPKLIVQVETPKNKPAMWYYDGSKSAQYEFLSRNHFTAEEINFLADMIDSCKAVTQDTSKAFIEKLLDALNESDENEVKMLRKEQKETKVKFDPKSENDYVQRIYKTIDGAIKGQKELNITLAYDKEECCLENVCVYSYFEENGKPYACIGNKENKLKKIELTKIKHIDFLGKASYYDEEIIDRLENKGFRQTTDKKDKSVDAEIFNDALFTNARYISIAKKERKYLQFSNHQSSLKNRFEAFKDENLIRTVIPLETIYKDSFYYLIAIEKIGSSDKTIFTRIDLMKNLMLGKNFSTEDLEKFNNKKGILKTDPYILSKTRSIDIQFWIKKDAIQRATDEFGDEAYAIEDANPLDTASEIRRKIGSLDPEYFTKSFTGFEYGDELIKVEAQATEEDTLRWVLENADSVELISPNHLRLKVLEITQALNKRYSKTEYDTAQDIYRKVISGKDFLTYGARTKFEEETRKRVANEKTFDKVTKLKIKTSETPISVSELEKYPNVEELVIDGNGVEDFSWVKKLASLRRLTLINTSIKNGDVLTDIPQLDLLFLNRNRLLLDYSFLKEMKIANLFIGENGNADVSALYDLRSVNNLVVEEKLLFGLDVERLINDSDEIYEGLHHMRVRRWIESGSRFDDLPPMYSIYPRLYCNKK